MTGVRPIDNPFAAQHIDNIPYHLNSGSWESLLAKLSRLNHRAAIIGPHGSGKTTLLETLKQRLSADGKLIMFFRVNTESTRLNAKQWQQLRQVDRQALILFDGADLLSVWAWWRFRRLSRYAKGLIVTSHSRRLLPPLINTQADNQLLHVVLSHLDIELTEQLQQQAEMLLLKHHGNIRDVLRDLYWSHADLSNHS